MPVGARRFHEAAFRGGTAGWMDVRWWFMDRLPFLLKKTPAFTGVYGFYSVGQRHLRGVPTYRTHRTAKNTPNSVWACPVMGV
jgi:hypothetical protein